MPPLLLPPPPSPPSPPSSSLSLASPLMLSMVAAAAAAAKRQTCGRARVLASWRSTAAAHQKAKRSHFTRVFASGIEATSSGSPTTTATTTKKSHCLRSVAVGRRQSQLFFSRLCLDFAEFGRVSGLAFQFCSLIARSRFLLRAISRGLRSLRIRSYEKNVDRAHVASIGVRLLRRRQATTLACARVKQCAIGVTRRGARALWMTPLRVDIFFS